MKPTLIELKAEGYDTFAQIQYLQNVLAEINKQIASYPKDVPPAEPVEEK